MHNGSRTLFSIKMMDFVSVDELPRIAGAGEVRR